MDLYKFQVTATVPTDEAKVGLHGEVASLSQVVYERLPLINFIISSIYSILPMLIFASQVVILVGA